MLGFLKAAKRLLTDESGVTAVEYGLIVAAIAAVVLVAFVAMYGNLSNAINSLTF
jgi:Flp pilus assembly pilin Flp